MGRHSNIIGVHLLFEHEGLLLLGRRAPTAAYAPDAWHVFAGHLERGESVLACAVREAGEELAVGVAEADLDLAHVVHYRDAEDHHARMQLFFRVRTWQGDFRINEPDRCTAMGWFAPDRLPSPLVDYTRIAIEAIGEGVPFSAVGWSPAPAASGGRRHRRAGPVSGGRDAAAKPAPGT